MQLENHMVTSGKPYDDPRAKYIPPDENDAIAALTESDESIPMVVPYCTVQEWHRAKQMVLDGREYVLLPIEFLVYAKDALDEAESEKMCELDELGRKALR